MLYLCKGPQKSLTLLVKKNIKCNDPCKNRNTRLVHAEIATAHMFLQQQKSGSLQMTQHRAERALFSLRFVVKKYQYRGQQSFAS